MSRLHLRGCMGLICGIASLALLGAGPAPASASTAPAIDGTTTTAVTAAAADPPEVFLVFTGEDTYEDAVLREAEANGPAGVTALVKATRDLAAAGEPITLEGATPENAPSVLERLDALLAQLGGTAQAQPVRAAGEGGGAGPLAINPPDYPQRGNKSSSQWDWQNLPLILEGKQCQPRGCDLTDRVKVTGSVSPGAVTTRANLNLLYFPDAGGFSSIHVDGAVMCWATTVCGTARTPNWTAGLKALDVTSNRSLRGNDIRHGYKLWAKPKNQTGYISDQAKTGKALCNASDNRCKYIY